MQGNYDNPMRPEFTGRRKPKNFARIYASCKGERLSDGKPVRSDRTTESLLARQALAEKATPGPWFAIHADDEMSTNASYIATKDEDVVPEKAYQHIVALTLYQAKRVACHEDERWDENAAHIAASDPSTVMDDIDEILRLRENVERLEKEADWLALVLANSGCGVPLTEYIDEGVNGMSPPAPEHWREAARNAMEGTGESCGEPEQIRETHNEQ